MNKEFGWKWIIEDKDQVHKWENSMKDNKETKPRTSR
jgi:hypothetical protein